jgi:hypothetical protein
MKREIDYRWRLPELMAARGLHNSTDLSPLLKERGIELSASKVYRLNEHEGGYSRRAP